MKSLLKTTSMKTQASRLIRLTMAAVTLAAFLAASLSLQAAKPGSGGGGGGGSPTGTIYFYSPPYYGDGLYYSMKADGTQKTPLGLTGNNASPSLLTHGGKRWFLQKLPVSGVDMLGNPRAENFAVREDGVIAVQLTDDPTMHINLDWTPVETASDAIVAGLGRRWNADGTPDVASMGVYVATLHFDAAGNVLGFDGTPEFLVSIGVVDPDGTGHLWWDGYSVSFSPDMSRLVAGHYYTTNGLRIVDVTTGDQTPLISGQAHSPAWSPDGTKIAFAINPTDFPGRIDVVSPDGTGRITVFKARWGYEYLSKPSWSPDSAYIAFQFSVLASWTDEVYRVPVGGGKAVNLTGDISIRALLMGWR